MNTKWKRKVRRSQRRFPRASKLRRRSDIVGAPGVIPEPVSALDPRLCDLALDALSSLESFIVSRTAGFPYSELREALRVEENERRQTVEAMQAIAENHRDWLREHSGPWFFLLTLTAAQIVKLDGFMRARPDADPPSDAQESRQELLWGLVFVFLPALILGLIFLLGKRGETK